MNKLLIALIAGGFATVAAAQTAAPADEEAAAATDTTIDVTIRADGGIANLEV